MDRLARQSGEVDIYVIKGVAEEADKVEPTPLRPIVWTRYISAVGIVAVCTVLCTGLFRKLADANLILVYLAGVVLVATRFGRGPSILASVLSVLAFDFFFVPPFFRFDVADSQYVLTFLIMLAVALVVSTLAVRTRIQAESATDRERRTAALYSMSRELASTQGMEDLAAVARQHVEEVFHGKAALYLPRSDGKVEPVSAAEGFDDRGSAQWVYDHKENGGWAPGRFRGPGRSTFRSASATG